AQAMVRRGSKGLDPVKGASNPRRRQSARGAVVSADHERFEQVAPDGIQFPEDFAPLTILLDKAEVPVGRTEVGGDPGVSRRHALLVRRPEGTYSVVDAGSANGTVVNDELPPIPPHVPVPLDAGDRVRIGAWTTLTLVPPKVV